MSNANSPFRKNPLRPWHGPLTGEGFKPRGDGYRLHEVHCEHADRWFELKEPGQPARADSPPAQLGERGFWKWVPDKTGAVRLFEFPQAAVGADDESEGAAVGADTSLGAFLRWALATKTNQVPPGWRPPARELVESWLPSGALTVQYGAIVRQGKLILTRERWALCFPIFPDLPAGLVAARREWLQRVLSNAQSVWRMVRVGITDDVAPSTVMAEVDFTGAPHSEYLFLAGLDGVRHVVAWLAESVEVVANPAVASEALALPPHANPKPERKIP